MNKSPACAPASAWVRRFASLIRPQGRVLDLAAGGGRHTAMLRELGHPVTAVDRDVSALAAVFADDSGCSVRTLDLENGAPWALGRDYDGIVVTNYLHRPLFPSLAAALAPGGILIYETFAIGNERFGKPRNPEFLLRPGELLAAFGTALSVIAFEQGTIEHPRPAVVQRIAATKDFWPFPLPPTGMAAP
jgi:SAM-dependent methyltransferase